MNALIYVAAFGLTTQFSLANSAVEQNENLFSLSLQELSLVNIASRIDENVNDAPSSVTVLSRKEIDRLGVRSLTELLNYVPGFQSLMSPHESNRSMILARGLADIYGRNLLLMIDGHRINDEYTGGFTFGDHLLSLYNVKKVEFIRGPGSALYGSNAFSGVINIITEKRKEAIVTVGSNNGRGVNAATYVEKDELSASISFNYYKDEGQNYSGQTARNGFNQSTQDPLRVFESRANLEYRQSRLILEYTDVNLDDYYVFRRISNGINRNDSNRVGIYLEHTFTLPPGWQGDSRIGYMRHDRYQRTLLASDEPPFIVDWQQDTTEAQADFNHLTATGHQLSLGGYIGTMDIPIAFSNEDIDRNVLDKRRITTGIYLQDKFELLTDLNITAGLRYDKYSDFGDSVNPRLAMTFRWRKHDSFKLMYGRAYRPPSLGDLYDAENTISSGNLFLNPVTVDSYELVYLHSKQNNRLALTGFYNDYRDFIGPRADNIFDNVYNNQTIGVELDLRLQLGNHWTSQTGVTHIISSKTQVQAGASFSQPEALAPKTYGNLQLNYQGKQWNWNISGVSRRSISVVQTKGILVVINSNLIYRANQQWQWNFNVRNLLDKSYNTPQNQLIGKDQSGNSFQQMPSRGREFFVSLRYSLG